MREQARRPPSSPKDLILDECGEAQRMQGRRIHFIRAPHVELVKAATQVICRWCAALTAPSGTSLMLGDAADYGFAVEERGLDWAKLKASRDAYVARLNDIYRGRRDALPGLQPVETPAVEPLPADRPAGAAPGGVPAGLGRTWRPPGRDRRPAPGLGIVLGEVFYVAGAGGTLNAPKAKPSASLSLSIASIVDS